MAKGLDDKQVGLFILKCWPSNLFTVANLCC